MPRKIVVGPFTHPTFMLLPEIQTLSVKFATF